MKLEEQPMLDFLEKGDFGGKNSVLASAENASNLHKGRDSPTLKMSLTIGQEFSCTGTETQS